MRYCEKCGYVMDEYDIDRDEQNCPICSGIWSEDDMTAIKYAELSETEKDIYDERLYNLIINNPNFDRQLHYQNKLNIENGWSYVSFRPEKMFQYDSHVVKSASKDNIEAWIQERKENEPFKPFPQIDNVKAREVSENAEITHKAIEHGYYSQNNTQPENIPKCPTCGSIDITRISTTAKVTNIALFGLLGQKRKHQFKCKNCGYEW